ncbi:MAG: hypothetical protein FWG81_03400 [Betaproteobacteria bacterium]|nr:hypothetical protein [Betaproteobacteria bacterium]
MVDTASQEKAGKPFLTPGEVQKFAADLPTDPLRAMDMVLEQLNAIPDNIDPVARFAVVSQLDEAVQPCVRQIVQEYLRNLTHNKAVEMRLWLLAHDFWICVADQYGICASAVVGSEGKSAQKLRPHLPRIISRALLAAGESLKWKSFHYQPIPLQLWVGTGSIYALAEKYAFAERQLQVYPGPGGISSPHDEFLRTLLFHAASLNTLHVREMEIADRLIVQLVPGFVLSAEKDERSLYWIDLGAEQEPSRINNPPKASPNLRYFSPGDALTRLQRMRQEAEGSGAIPGKICRNDKFELQDFLNVARHLANYWSATPPQRQHERHRVNHSISVLPGFVNSFVIASPEFGGKAMGLPLEKWIVENVSRGGFGAIIKQRKNDWVRVGALIVLQPEGADNWVIGLIRRVQRASDQEIRVGIETLSKRPISLETRARAASDKSLPPGIPAIWFQDDDPKSPMRFFFPSGELKMGDILEFDFNGRRIVAHPVEVLERGGDYDLVTCKVMVAAAPAKA